MTVFNIFYEEEFEAVAGKRLRHSHGARTAWARERGHDSNLHARDGKSLLAKLARFYADRTLTRTPISPADQAEAYFLLVGERLSKITGQILAVDGGLIEAFLR